MFATLVFCTALGAGADSSEPAYEYALEGARIRVTAPDGVEAFVDAGCPGTAMHRASEQLFVACGTAGVAIHSIASRSTPQLITIRDFGGRVIGFHRSGERLWVEVATVQAKPLGEYAEPVSESGAHQDTSPAVRPNAPAVVEETETHVVGEVSKSLPGAVVVSLGSSSGLRVGDPIALYELREMQLAPGEAAEREHLIAVGRVVAVSEAHARVDLGLNEQVSVGTKARPAEASVTANKWLPPRAADLWSISAALRPFLALGSLGFGTVSDLSVGYRFDEPVHVQVVLEPLGFGLADEGNIVASAGNVFVSYDHRAFEIGLGAGWSAVNNRLGGGDAMREADNGELTFDNVKYGTSIAQLGRLGSEDGLHLMIRNTFILYDDAFHYGGTVGQVLVPLTERSWLLGRGGGGAAGFGFGELGLRILLSGNGYHDSLFVSASIGGAGLSGEARVADGKCDTGVGGYYRDEEGDCYTSADYAGPMVGLGFEWRP